MDMGRQLGDSEAESRGSGHSSIRGRSGLLGTDQAQSERQIGMAEKAGDGSRGWAQARARPKDMDMVCANTSLTVLQAANICYRHH